jgi:hypothetical protein
MLHNAAANDLDQVARIGWTTAVFLDVIPKE